MSHTNTLCVTMQVISNSRLTVFDAYISYWVFQEISDKTVSFLTFLNAAKVRVSTTTTKSFDSDIS
jgi:predicted aconitase